jgi:glycosyltransferase involved in cell wall biosynthesis
MVELVFWCAAGLVFYAYLGYPMALAALARFRSRPIRKRDITPRLSFIITAHNEEGRLHEKLANTLAQDYPTGAFEVIVASDCSTDRTDEIVRGYAPRVRLIRAEQRRGKEAAQQIAVEAASGDILIFSDVATALAPGALRTMAANFADPTVGCVSSVDRFVDADGRVSGEGAYVRYEMWLRSLETQVNTLVGLSGSFFAARRAVCQPWAADRQSDFNTVLNAIGAGLRGVLDLETAGYYRNIADDRREFDRKVRTVVRGMFVLASSWRMLNPFEYGLFAWQLASHKLARWLVPFGMIAAFVSSAALASHSTFHASVFALQCGFYAAAVGGLRTGAPALRIPAFLVLANVGVLTAWIRLIRGDRIVFWTPSARIGRLPHASAP